MKTRPFEVAIHPDDGGPKNSSSPRWISYLEREGVRVRVVDAYDSHFLTSVAGCDGFMWRFNHGSADMQVARRILPLLEVDLGLRCYPNRSMNWHFDDKVTQAYVFAAHGVPMPATHVFFRRDDAAEFIRTAQWPMVIKLARGAGSSNVRIVGSRREAEGYLRLMFDRGAVRMPLPRNVPRTIRETRQRLSTVARSLGVLPADRWENWDVQRGCILLQEFLPDNAFDTRVTVIGNRAFAFRRMNRPGDFRSSGSGLLEYEPEAIDLETVRVAFATARKLGAQSCAVDGLRRGDERVVGEVSYTYDSGCVQACAGHWDSELNWHEGRLWPEDAQAEDFLNALRARP